MFLFPAEFSFFFLFCLLHSLKDDFTPLTPGSVSLMNHSTDANDLSQYFTIFIRETEARNTKLPNQDYRGQIRGRQCTSTATASSSPELFLGICGWQNHIWERSFLLRHHISGGVWSGVRAKPGSNQPPNSASVPGMSGPLSSAS